ncbi:hypothetical protein GEOBRER4_n0224 [Citrifermentans bremense]|uniref:Uncharacterized protein n=2 Tax=Geobacteraceae TaxID=213422 RepID=A0ABQ0MLY0_9BACT|nr:hypothetical protein GEOBRER4_n0224 [Citrifermentans bremense]GAW68093.1 hypothetical protein GPEL0_01r4269 [Geoanaerobacter pelophilus]
MGAREVRDAGAGKQEAECEQQGHEDQRAAMIEGKSSHKVC